MASEYGWTVRTVRDQLTDEQLVLYLDSMVDRVEATRDARFDAMVESARLGVVFAHSPKHHERWIRRRKQSRGEPVGLTGEALERAVTAYQMTTPEYVVTGPANG
jgi:hypothetical protein